jgi:hypothetical protein
VERAALDLRVVSVLPIVWHSTTPRHFECQPGCVCCCVDTLFFPSEAAHLPEDVAKYLSVCQGLIRPLQRPPGVCAFFDVHSPWHCGIPQHRPLRCRLYPYLPVISGESIVIVADPLCTVTWPETDYPAWYRCYGLGRGSLVAAEIEAMSREFLKKMVTDHPDVARGQLYVRDVDAVMNSTEVEKQRHPLYADWDTERIRKAAQLDYGASFGAVGSAREPDHRRCANGFW